MAAASSTELNHRQRNVVYMHSSIFDDDRNVQNSVYAPSRQAELYSKLGGTLGNNKVNKVPPDLKHLVPLDMACTQNAGHGPSYDLDAHRQGDSEAHRDIAKVVRANPKDNNIPQEFWKTTVNLQWHDPSNQINRERESGARTGAARKRQELSSGMFGAPRYMHHSTENPKQELLADSADLFTDSTHHRTLERRQSPPCQGHRDRHRENLATSQRSTFRQPAAPGGYPGEGQVPHENPATQSRRRQERNFSELFGREAGERNAGLPREEVTGTRSVDCFDVRGEIATRNKDRWRHDTSPPVDKRRQAEMNSRIFSHHQSPERPQVEPQVERTSLQERTVWDTKGLFEASSEIARRDRLREFSGGDPRVTALERKQESLNSRQLRLGTGAPPQKDEPRGSPGPKQRITVSARPRPDPEFGYSAKSAKQAELASSIFA